MQENIGNKKLTAPRKKRNNRAHFGNPGRQADPGGGDEEDVLEIIEEELSDAANITLHAATTCRQAQQSLLSYTCDFVILDIMGVGGFYLLEIANNAAFPVVVITAHAFTPDAMKKSIELGARAYLPKQDLGSLIPFLEDVPILNYRSAWKKALTKYLKLILAHDSPPPSPVFEKRSRSGVKVRVPRAQLQPIR